MKKLTLLALTLTSALTALGALAQVQAPVPRSNIAPRPMPFAPRNNGAFACFADETSTPPLNVYSPLPGTIGRDLAGQVTWSNRMTNDACRATCAANNFVFAGTQSGAFCFCGNSAGTHGTSNACGAPCMGSPGEVCGGPSSNSVSWSQDFVGAFPVAPAPPANGGQCLINIGGPGYRHSELHRWTVTGPPMMAPTGKQYPLTWTVSGSGASESVTTSPGHSQVLIRSWTLSGSHAVTYQARLSNGTFTFAEATTPASGQLQEAPQRQYIDGALQTPRMNTPGSSAEYSASASMSAQALGPVAFSTNVMVNASMGGFPAPYAAHAGWAGTIQCTWNLLQ